MQNDRFVEGELQDLSSCPESLSFERVCYWDHELHVCRRRLANHFSPGRFMHGSALGNTSVALIAPRVKDWTGRRISREDRSPIRCHKIVIQSDPGRCDGQWETGKTYNG